MQVSQVRIYCFTLIAMLCASGISLTAYGQTDFVYVNIDREWPSIDPEDGESWETAFRFLQDAITRAAILVDQPGIDTVEIWVAQGTYRPDQRAAICGTQDEDCPDCGDCDPEASFELRNNVEIYGGFSGEGWETELDDRDWELNPTILDGDLKQNDDVTIYDPQTGELVLEFDDYSYSDNSYAVVAAESEVVVPVVTPGTNECECDSGPADCSCSDFDEQNPGADTSLNRCDACPNFCDVCSDPQCNLTTINATAVLDGFHIRGANVEPAEFERNSLGGALRIASASPTIRNCIIRENRNSSNTNDVDGVGITIALPIPQQITMQNVTVRHNRAHRCPTAQGDLELVAGIWIGNKCPVPSVKPSVIPRRIVLLDVEIAENIGTDGTTGNERRAGGGLFVESSLQPGSDGFVTEVTVVNSTIHKNVKIGAGSAIHVGGNSELRLWNSLVHRNEAKDSNTAGGGGTGAIYKVGAGEVEIINSTIVDNTADTETGGLHLEVSSGVTLHPSATAGAGSGGR